MYGICVDGPDGDVRLVMDLCEDGSLLDAVVKARPKVCAVRATHALSFHTCNHPRALARALARRALGAHGHTGTRAHAHMHM